MMMLLRAVALLALPLRRTSLLLPAGRARPQVSRRSGIFMVHDDATPPSTNTAPPSKADLPDGFLVVHKPQDWTSFDVVGRVRGVLEKHFKQAGHTFGRKSRLKVGHGGTLDPLATGLLVLGVGRGTKRMAAYLGGSKAYVARAQLGAETDTQDSCGTVTRDATHEHVTLSALEEAATKLTGEIMQRPPIYSALRKDGKRLYELARAGEITPDEVELRPVTVHRLAVHSFDRATGEFGLDVRCSGGTYVRTLIEDLGRAVGSAAHMSALERTRHGPFCSAAEAEAVSQRMGSGEHDGATDDNVPALVVTPVVEEELADPLRLLAAVEEATAALEATQPAVESDRGKE